MNRTFKSQTQIFYIKSVIATKMSNCGANEPVRLSQIPRARVRSSVQKYRINLSEVHKEKGEVMITDGWRDRS